MFPRFSLCGITFEINFRVFQFTVITFHVHYSLFLFIIFFSFFHITTDESRKLKKKRNKKSQSVIPRMETVSKSNSIVKLDEPWVFENLMASRESPEVSSRNIITKFGSRMNFVGIFMMRHDSGNQIRKTLSVIYHVNCFTKVL